MRCRPLCIARPLLTPFSSADLTRLSLYNLIIVEVPHVSLSRVAELTCDTVETNSHDKTSFLSSSTLPSLRTLAFTQHRTIRLDACAVSEELYANLLCITILDPDTPDALTLNNCPPSCPIFGTLSLTFNRNFFGKSASVVPLVAHCRVRAILDRIDSVGVIQGLEAVAAAIDNTDPLSLRLSRLSRRTSLSPVRLPSTPTSNTPAAVQAVLQACNKRGVEVIFEDGNDTLGAPFLSVSALKYAKQLEVERNGGSSL